MRLSRFWKFGNVILGLERWNGTGDLDIYDVRENSLKNSAVFFIRDIKVLKYNIRTLLLTGLNIVVAVFIIVGNNI